MSGVASSPNVVSSVRPIHPSRGPSPAENAGEASPFTMLLESNNAEPSAAPQPDRVAPPKAAAHHHAHDDKRTDTASDATTDTGSDTPQADCAKPDGNEAPKTAKGTGEAKGKTKSDGDGSAVDATTGTNPNETTLATDQACAKGATSPVVSASAIVPVALAALVTPEVGATWKQTATAQAVCEKTANVTTPAASVTSDVTSNVPQAEGNSVETMPNLQLANAGESVGQAQNGDTAGSAKRADDGSPKIIAAPTDPTKTADPANTTDKAAQVERVTVATDTTSTDQTKPTTTPNTTTALKQAAQTENPNGVVQTTSTGVSETIDGAASKSAKQSAKSVEGTTPTATENTQVNQTTPTAAPKLDAPAVNANAPIVARDPAPNETATKTDLETAISHRLAPDSKGGPATDLPRVLDAVNLKIGADATQSPNPSLTALQTVSTPAQILATPVAAGAAATAAIPLAALPVEIAAQAKDGKNRFEIRLDPPELGRIDVRLDIDRNGHVTSRLMVERPETLDLLRRDAHQIERALQDAGLKTSDQGLQFSLRDQSFAEQSDNALPTTSRIVVQDEIVPAPIINNYGRLLGLGSGIDIRV